jgi:hypothetical protein
MDCTALYRIFNKKGRQQIGREDCIQGLLRRMRGLEGVLYEAAKNFDLLLKIQNHIKKIKTYSI